MDFDRSKVDLSGRMPLRHGEPGGLGEAGRRGRGGDSQIGNAVADFEGWPARARRRLMDEVNDGMPH